MSADDLLVLLRNPRPEFVESIAARHWEVRHKKGESDVTASYRKWVNVDFELAQQWRENAREFLAALAFTIARGPSKPSSLPRTPLRPPPRLF